MNESGAFLDHQPMQNRSDRQPFRTAAEQGMPLRARAACSVEKPIDINTERADALIDECTRANVKLGVFFQDRVAPGIRRSKNMVDAANSENRFWFPAE